MRGDSCKRVSVRFGAALIATVALGLGGTMALYAAGPPGLQRYTDGDGTRWLTGCVEDQMANTLVSQGAFDYGGPLPILCIQGYTLISKQLGR